LWQAKFHRFSYQERAIVGRLFIMIKRQKSSDGVIKVTFSLPLEQAPEATSVAGDFNNWDPLANPMKKRSNGTRSASVEIPEGEVVNFRYLANGGQWFNDDEADFGDSGNNVLAA